MTLRIMLVTRNVVSVRAMVFAGRRPAAARPCRPLTIREIAWSGLSRAAVGEQRVGARDLERCGFEHAERDRRVGPRRRAGADAPPQRRDLVVSGRLGDLDRGDVARQGERAAQRDRPFELAVVVGRASRSAR